MSFLGLFYGRSSRYFYRTGRDSFDIITAVEGVEQGGAAGPALFAAGLRDPLVRLRTELASLSRSVALFRGVRVSFRFSAQVLVFKEGRGPKNTRLGLGEVMFST